MFDIGFWELLFIGLIALVVIGPERLPGMAVMAGQWVGRLRRYAQHVRSQINEELETEHLRELLSEQHREIDELRREVGSVRDSAVQTVRDVESQARDIGRNSDDASQDEAVDHGADVTEDAATDDSASTAHDTANPAASDAEAADAGTEGGADAATPAGDADSSDDARTRSDETAP